MRVRFVLAGLGLAVTVSSPGLLLPRQAAAAPDDTRGMALLSAAVSNAGVLLDGTGATSATRELVGVYRITFDRDVTDCFYAPALFRPGGAFIAGSVAAGNPAAAGKKLSVVVRDAAGDVADIAFHVVVFCNK